MTGSMTARERWDAVVVGAGIAGAVTARGLAKRGLTVLLVERARLPRSKVCGGCLSSAGLAVLDDLGLSGLPSLATAPHVTRLELRVSGATVKLDLPAGRAVTRSRLDSELARAAVEAGAVLVEGTRAEIGAVFGTSREVTLFSGTGPRRVRASVVVNAAGLAGPGAVPGGELHTSLARGSWIGVGTVLSAAETSLPRSMISMSIGRGGYVGMVRVEGDEVLVAAALDPGPVRSAGGPAPVIAGLLEACGTALPDGLVAGASWTATPRLTRRTRPVAAERLFLAGDASGYVEPFTGEGMTWALDTAAALIPIAARAAQRWDSGTVPEWEGLHHRLVGRRRRRCRRLTGLLHHPALTGMVIRLLARHPGIASPLIHRTSAATPLQEVLQ